MRHHHHHHCHEGSDPHGGPHFRHRRSRFGRWGHAQQDGVIEPAIEAVATLEAEATPSPDDLPVRLFTCVGKGCAHGAEGKALLAALNEAVAAHPTPGVRIDVRACGCLDVCEQGPVVVAYQGNAAKAARPPKGALAGLHNQPVDRFGQVSPDDAGRIVETVLHKTRRS